MKTITLSDFIAKEIENDIESGFAFQIGDSVEADINAALKNKDVRAEMWDRMVKRYTKLQEMGKVSGLV